MLVILKFDSLCNIGRTGIPKKKRRPDSWKCDLFFSMGTQKALKVRAWRVGSQWAHMGPILLESQRERLSISQALKIGFYLMCDNNDLVTTPVFGLGNEKIKQTFVVYLPLSTAIWNSELWEERLLFCPCRVITLRVLNFLSTKLLMNSPFLNYDV